MQWLSLLGARGEGKKLLFVEMKGVIAFVLCLSAASSAVLKFDEYKDQWQAWKTFHDKKYETDTEEEARYAIWRDNLRVSKRLKNDAGDTFSFLKS